DLTDLPDHPLAPGDADQSAVDSSAMAAGLAMLRGGSGGSGRGAPAAPPPAAPAGPRPSLFGRPAPGAEPDPPPAPSGRPESPPPSLFGRPGGGGGSASPEAPAPSGRTSRRS